MIIKRLIRHPSFARHPSCKHSLIFLASIAMMNSALANPAGGVVASGSATISSSGKTTTIQQGSQQAIINWNSFNIQNGEKTQFVQPNSSSVALNRINPTQGASTINGQLTSNGQIILVNAAGLHFGSGANVNVGGLIASTSDITNANFLAGKYIFDQASTYHNATVTNQGSIVAANYGLVAFLGNTVINNGMIQAEMGSVVLGSGAKFTLDFNGDQLINFTVDAPASAGSITNTGSMIADGGKILLTAQAATSVLDNVIDLAGNAQANSVSQQGGEIILSANGGVTVAGKVKASGAGANSNGGSIQITANNFNMSSQGSLDVSGDTGGGSINIAANSAVFVNSSMKANALLSGTGGSIAINAKSAAAFANSLVSATGVGTGTSGGSIQVTANNISLTQGSLLNANGDLIGGSVNLSGVPNAGNATNANSISLDSWSGISANATGLDSVVGGNVNLYANTALLSGSISANDNLAQGVGGDISIYGQNLYVLPGATIDASAAFVGGVINLGGNPYSTSSSLTSANVVTSFFTDVTAAVTGSSGFGGEITVSGDNVSLGGELDVSGVPLPYFTYTSSGSSNSNLFNFCGGGGGSHVTPVLNNSGSSAGVITVTGNAITVQSGADLNAAGNVFGGEIQIGNQSGPASASIFVSAGSLLDAGSYGTAATNLNGGVVKLYANNTTMNGNINASGAANSGSLGGEIQIFANNTINIGSFATIVANADADGGQIEIGGDQNGQGFDPNAQFTNIAAFSVISASAITNGIGGNVVVWSDNTTNFAGTIFARGGAKGGDGGDVQVAGAQVLNLSKIAYVDVSAPHGNAGVFTTAPSATVNNTGYNFMSPYYFEQSYFYGWHF